MTEPLQPAAAWVLIPRYVEQGAPVWFAREEDAREALARGSAHTYYLCRLEAARGPEADRLPMRIQGLV